MATGDVFRGERTWSKPYALLCLLAFVGMTVAASNVTQSILEELKPQIVLRYWGIAELSSATHHMSVLSGQMLLRVQGFCSSFHIFATQKWEEMLTNHSPFMIASVFTFVIHEVAYFLAYLPWLVLDLIPQMRKFKLQPTKINTSSTHWSCFKAIVYNHVCVQFPMMIVFHAIATTGVFTMETPLPSFRSLLWQVPVFYIIEDFYFYWIHRFLHWKRIYKYVHKVHHEYKAPFGLAAEYAHPVETMFLGIGSVLGPFLFARHLLTLWIWLVFRIFETVEDHSGYDIPWNPTNLIPFWGGAVHHDFHHKTFEGPYSSVFTFWDWVFGTDKSFRLNQQKLNRGEPIQFYPVCIRASDPDYSLELSKKFR